MLAGTCAQIATTCGAADGECHALKIDSTQGLGRTHSVGTRVQYTRTHTHIYMFMYMYMYMYMYMVRPQTHPHMVAACQQHLLPHLIRRKRR